VVVGRVKVKLSLYRPWRPIGLWDVEDPTLSRHLGHSTGCVLDPGNIFLLLVLISVRG
jgi:hypothetical protein